MSSVNIPGVGTLTSTALTPGQVNVILQALLLQCLGVTVDPTNALDPGFNFVRLDWPTPGQPGFEVTDDQVFISALQTPDIYDEQSERQTSLNDDTSYTETRVYTRAWRIALAFYGPNSSDNARQVKTCMNQTFVSDTLGASELFLTFPLGTPVRAPEPFQNQYWERTDFAFKLYEQVTETLVKPSIASVEIIIQDDAGNGSDQIIVFPGYGVGGYGAGAYGGL